MTDKPKTEAAEMSLDGLRAAAALIDKGIANFDAQIKKFTDARTSEKKKLRAIMGRIETQSMRQFREDQANQAAAAQPNAGKAAA